MPSSSVSRRLVTLEALQDRKDPDYTPSSPTNSETMSYHIPKANPLGDISPPPLRRSSSFNQDEHPSEDSEGDQFHPGGIASNILNATEGEIYSNAQMDFSEAKRRAAPASRGLLEDELKMIRESFRRQGRDIDRVEVRIFHEMARERKSRNDFMESEKHFWAVMSTLREDIDGLQQQWKGAGQTGDLWIYERKLDGIASTIDEYAELGGDERLVERSKKDVKDVKEYLQGCTKKIDILEKELQEIKKERDDKMKKLRQVMEVSDGMSMNIE